MADIHLSGSGNANLIFGSNDNGGSVNLADPTMPVYVGARAVVTRVTNGVRIWLKDYKGETSEVIAEAIQSVTTNADGSLIFTLPDGRTLTTGSLKGPQGDQGPQGEDGEQGPAGADGADGQDGADGSDGVGIASIELTGTSGLVDTYTITYTDGDTDTFTVTNGADGQDGTNGTNGTDGVGISSITKTSTSGLVDEYTITYTNGNATQFTVTNGKDGEDGQDGSVVTATQIVSTGTKIATIAIDGTDTDIYAPSGGGGGSDEIFFAVYNTTSFADVLTAYNNGEYILCEYHGSNTLYAPLTAIVIDGDTDDVVAFGFSSVVDTNLYRFYLDGYDGWSSGNIVSVTYSDATTTSRGLMTAADKTKLNGIASGAEVNVQSDWSQTDSSADDYIKNKPTIPTVPTNVSAFTNDAGYLTSFTETDPTVPSWAKASSKPSYSASEISGLVDMFYPVGSYYETSDTSFNPNTEWSGTTWVLETEGQVHISGSVSGTYQVSGAPTDTSDGGEATHTLITDEMPSHSHSVYYVNYNRGSGSSTTMGYLSSQAQTNNAFTSATGSGQAHNNMQPYIIVNRWHRTA